MPLDVTAIRRRFPAFSRDEILLDGPAGTPVPHEVIDAVSAATAVATSNVGGAFSASRRSEEVVAEARAAGADLFGGAPDEIVFGPNMTTLSFSISRAIARTWSPGDRIILSGLDHDANVMPWVMAAADRGADVEFVDIDTSDMSLDIDHLGTLLDARTRLVAVTGASNAFGTTVDVAAVAEMAHSVGALCFVDAVHLAPHRRIDAPGAGVDLMVCSAYKFFGPHVGSMWIRREVAADLEAYKVRPAPADPPGRFETGTPSFALLAGYTAAVDYLAGLGSGDHRPAFLDSAFDRIGARERILGDAFLDGLGGQVTLHGRPTMDGRVSTFAVRVAGEEPSATAARLAEAGIAVWSGHNYAVEPVRRAGLEGGIVRIGILHTTTEGEVERVLDELG